MREGPIIESAVITDKFVIMTNEVKVWFKKRYIGLIAWQLHQRLLAGWSFLDIFRYKRLNSFQI